jgi:hypothetical protein
MSLTPGVAWIPGVAFASGRTVSAARSSFARRQRGVARSTFAQDATCACMQVLVLAGRNNEAARARPGIGEGGSLAASCAFLCQHPGVNIASRLTPRSTSPLDQKFLPKVDLPGPKRGEGRPNRFWQEPTPLSIGKCFVLAAHPRRGVPRFFPELASNLVVIVNKTYARNHVYGGLAKPGSARAERAYRPAKTGSASKRVASASTRTPT